MKRHLAFAVVTLGALGSACDLILPAPADDVIVLCSANADCPSRQNCIPSLGRCVPINETDLDAPAIFVDTLTPAAARLGQTVELVLVADEALIEAPFVTTIGPQDGEGLVLARTEQDGDVYIFAGVVQDATVEGPHEIYVEAIDLAGNSGGFQPLGTFDVDMTPPQLATDDAVSVPQTPLSADQTAVVQVVFNEPIIVSDNGPRLVATADLTFALQAQVGDELTAVQFLATVPDGVVGTVGLGIEAVTDRAGNTTEAIAVDKVIALDAAAPMVASVSLNAERFSHRDGYNQIEATITLGEVLTDGSVSAILSGDVDADINCDDAPETINNVSVFTCDSTIPPPTAGDEEALSGPAALVFTVKDAAENSATVARELAFDFVGPEVVNGSANVTLVPPAGYPFPIAAQATTGVRVRAVFSLTEAPAGVPDVDMVSDVTLSSTRLDIVEDGGAAFVAEALFLGDPTDDGTWSINIEATDAVGNPAQSTFAGFVSDTTPPDAPRVADPGRIIFHRLPWPQTDGGAPRFWVDGRTDAVEAAAVVIALDAFGQELGRTRADNDGSFLGSGALDIGGADRDRVSLQAVDPAGNLSTIVGVRDVEWTATMGAKVAGSTLENPHIVEQRTVMSLYSRDGPTNEVQAPSSLLAADGVSVSVGTLPYFTNTTDPIEDSDPRGQVAADPHSGELWGYATNQLLPVPKLRRWTGYRWADVVTFDAEGDGDPPARLRGLVFDERRSELVAFDQDATWVFNGESFRKVATSDDPEYPTSPGVGTWDPETGVVWTVSGGGLYRWSGTRWTLELTSAAFPADGQLLSPIYDRARQMLVLMSTAQGFDFGTDVYEYDGTVIVQRQAADDCLGARAVSGPSMAYDPVLQSVVVADWGYALDVNDPTLNECQPTSIPVLPVQARLWIWTGTAFTPHDQTTGRTSTMGMSLGFRPLSGQAVLSAGENDLGFGSSPSNYTSAQNTRGTWMNYEGRASELNDQWPRIREKHSLLALPSGPTLLFGGEFSSCSAGCQFGSFPELHQFSIGGAPQIHNATTDGMAPDSRAAPIAYSDLLEAPFLMETGFGPTGHAIWRFDTDNLTWTRLVSWDPSNALSPGDRHGAGFAYDRVENTFITFGGDENRTDTYSWFFGEMVSGVGPVDAGDPNGVTAPAPRNETKMVWDDSRSAIVLFGGRNATGLLNDTWVWNGTAWSELVMTNPPPARFGQMMAYDARRGHVVMLGGMRDDDRVMDATDARVLWELVDDEWTAVTFADPLGDGSPEALGYSAMTFSGNDNALMLFAGRTGDQTFSEERWVLKMSGDGPGFVGRFRLNAAGAADARWTSVSADVSAAAFAQRGPDALPLPGADVSLWTDRWARYARGDSEADAEPLALTVTDEATLNRAIVGTSREVAVAITPQWPSGRAARPDVTLDALSFSATYVLPAASCGDGIVDDDEVCDGSADCTSECRAIRCGDGLVAATETCDDGNLVSGDGCSDTCASEGGPSMGDLVISELMVDPLSVSDDAGEFIEIENRSGRRLDLVGLKIDVDGDIRAIAHTATLAPGDRAVFGHDLSPDNNGDAGVRRLMPHTGDALADGGGTVRLLDPVDSEIDALTWGTATPGVSIQRDAALAQCDSAYRYNSVDFGSPGTGGGLCP